MNKKIRNIHELKPSSINLLVAVVDEIKDLARQKNCNVSELVNVVLGSVCTGKEALEAVQKYKTQKRL